MVAPVFTEAGDVQFYLPEVAGHICGTTMNSMVVAGINRAQLPESARLCA